ncbi:hypothetical protein [Desulfitobacterium hafniense]|uniref:Uncharacterized protein n=1 Tax=Desulfitobacterium hafniense DP7 TaxID=537010 RepID=G9XRH4_DESHA|nr:hypothetical protein [Desulfitobacterium hafniense]EHL05812.1 hypothetical protein HMPREF0322_03572 [Desulfitobacterium hafniense DP7]MEA5021753.1 hypothetical protein [Desulfitobacterium hafniense]
MNQLRIHSGCPGRTGEKAAKDDNRRKLEVVFCLKEMGAITFVG